MNYVGFGFCSRVLWYLFPRLRLVMPCGTLRRKRRKSLGLSSPSEAPLIMSVLDCLACSSCWCFCSGCAGEAILLGLFLVLQPPLLDHGLPMGCVLNSEQNLISCLSMRCLWHIYVG